MDLARTVSRRRAAIVRAESAPWALRTEEKKKWGRVGACCDPIVKSFEVWAGVEDRRRGRQSGLVRCDDWKYFKVWVGKSKGDALGGKVLGTQRQYFK